MSMELTPILLQEIHKSNREIKALGIIRQIPSPSLFVLQKPSQDCMQDKIANFREQRAY